MATNKIQWQDSGLYALYPLLSEAAHSEGADVQISAVCHPRCGVLFLPKCCFHRKRTMSSHKRRTDVLLFPHAYHTNRGGAHGGRHRRNIVVDRMGKRYVRATRKELKCATEEATLPIWKRFIQMLPNPTERKSCRERNWAFLRWRKAESSCPAFPIIRFR